MMKRNGNRVVAFLLAMLMVASTMGSTSLTAYAQGTATDVEILTEENITEEISTEEGTTGQTTTEEVTTEASSEVSVTEVTSEETDATTEETNAEEDNTTEENMDVVLEDVVEEEGDPAYIGGPGVYENSWLIDANAMIEAGMEFNDDNLIAIAEYIESQGNTYETVQIQYPDDSKYSYTVSKDVWNAMKRIQNDNGSDEDSRGIDFIFPTVSGNCVMTWHFRYIMEATSDVVMDMDWTINEAEQGIGVSFSNVIFPASFVNVQIRVGTLYGEYAGFCNAFKKEDDGVLYDASGKCMNGVTVVNYVTEGSDCYFVIKEVGNLTANAGYTVNNKKYTGKLEKASDGVVSLWIYDEDWETEEELAEMIRANKNMGVHKVWIYDSVPGNSRTISTDVINAAAEILSEMPEGITGDSPSINLFSDYKGLDVLIYAPSGTLTGESVTFSMDISVSDNEAMVKKNAPEIEAERVVLRQYFTEESIQDPFREIYPDASGLTNLYIGDQNLQANYYNIEGGENSFSLGCVSELNNDEWYEIKNLTSGVPADVPGKIFVDPSEGYTTLDFHAEEIDKEVLENGDIAEALAYYKEQIEAGKMEPFRYINIRQNNTDKDIIYKDDFNFLRSLIDTDTDVYTGIYYYFEIPSTVSGNEVENYEQWRFSNPTAATKDMDVSNVSIRTLKNCVKVQFPDNTYPSEYVSYIWAMDNRLEMANALYTSFHNQTDNSSSGFRIFSNPEKLTELYYATCIFWDYSYGSATNYSLDIGWVNKLGTEEHTMIKYLEDEPLYIGEPRQFKTTVTPDEGSPINYDNITSRATVNDEGVIIPSTEGTAMYLASYKVDGEWTVDYWHADVSKKLLSMKFANASVANPLEIEMAAKGSDEPNTEQLKLSYYPTGTTPEPDELEWFVGTISDNSVSANNIQLETDINGNPTGKIIAVSEGEAVVTVTHKEKPNVCAKAKIVVKPNLNDEEIESREALGNIYAITNLDKTLKDINLPEGSGYSWVDDSMTLASQDRGGEGCYPAIYKSPIDGREKNVSLSVDLRTFILSTDLCLNDKDIFTDKIAMDHGDVLYIDAWGEDWGSGESELLAQLLAERNLHFDCVLSSDPKDIVQESDDLNYKWMFTADSAKSGKKNFTVELLVVYDETGDKVSIEKKNYTITVAKNPIMNWDDFEVVKATDGEAFEIGESSPKGELGEFVFMQPKEKAFGLTIKSLDPKVCKIIKQESPQEDGDQMVTRVFYECLAGGKAQISVTAKDEMKSNKVYQFDVIDVMPRALESMVTIDVNRTEEEQTDSVEWLLNAGTTILGEEEELLLGDNGGLFNIDNKEGDDVKLHLVNEDTDTVELCAELLNPSIKKGKYKVDITAPVMYGEDQSADFTTTVTINITDVEPKVTLKQTKKVNLFYTDEHSYGEFTLKSSLGTIDDVQLLPPDNKNCDYTIEETEQPDTYIVKLADDAETDKNKSGVLEVSLEEYSDPVNVKFSIKTENKKPTLVLSQKTDVLYPNYTANVTSVLQFTDKATGEVIDNISAVEYKSGKDFVALEEGENAVKGNKNTYAVTADTDKITFVLEEDSRQKTTDKFSLKIKGDNWKTSIPVSYSIKVETTNPKLALSTKTINFNMNEKVYRNEVVYVDLAFKGVAAEIEDIGNVLITAYPGEAETALNKWISAEYVDGRVRVALEDIEGLSKSSYTWKFYITVYGEETSFYVWDTVTVKLTNTAPEKCISASAKGNIDVLDSTKCITYTPKLKGVQGKVVDGYLIGPDEDMFTEVFEDGVLKVYPFDGETYSTKTKYSVKPVFIVENADGEIINLEMEKIQTIKVKQGKPKLKVDKATWYRDRQSEIKIPVSAVLNGKNVPINDVELTNFTNDLNASYEDGYIVLERIGVDKINAIGKTYNLKLNVYYADGAFNEKPASTTLKLTVK